MILASSICSYKIVVSAQALSVRRAYTDGGVPNMARARKEAKFEVFGQEMVEKVVAKSGSSGRVSLPRVCIEKRVKATRVDWGPAMVSRFGPKDFAACGRCGSGQVHPKLLVMGPIAGIDSDSRTFVCHACGHEGLPIFFDTQEARAQFEREKKGLWDAEPKAAKKGVLTIPILPIQTDPLIALKILAHLPVRVATVTGVRWEDGQLNPTAYRASYQEYWDAIGGPPHNAPRVVMLDPGRINRPNPQLQVT